MQAQELCRKGEAKRGLLPFCWHCSILGSSDILNKKKKKAESNMIQNLEARTVRSTAGLYMDKAIVHSKP